MENDIRLLDDHYAVERKGRVIAVVVRDHGAPRYWHIKAADDRCYVSGTNNFSGPNEIGEALRIAALLRV